MENEDCREPRVRYGKVKAIVVLLNYPPKSSGGFAKGDGNE